jgi:hypothetical protein
MARNALSYQDGELSVPVRHDRRQLRAAVVPRADLADDQQRAQGPFDGIAEPLHHFLGGVATDAKRLRKFGTAQAVPVDQIQNFAVAVGDSALGLGDQRS